jgi:hypothetical protein
MSIVVVFETETYEPNVAHAATEDIRNHNEEIPQGQVPDVIFRILS